MNNPGWSRSADWENHLDAEQARFFYWKENRAKPESVLSLTRWSKSCVF